MLSPFLRVKHFVHTLWRSAIQIKLLSLHIRGRPNIKRPSFCKANIELLHSIMSTEVKMKYYISMIFSYNDNMWFSAEKEVKIAHKPHTFQIKHLQRISSYSNISEFMLFCLGLLNANTVNRLVHMEAVTLQCTVKSGQRHLHRKASLTLSVRPAVHWDSRREEEAVDGSDT